MYQPGFILGEAVARGALQALTLDHPPHDLGGIHAVWPAGHHVPAKVRATVDFLLAHLPPEALGPGVGGSDQAAAMPT